METTRVDTLINLSGGVDSVYCLWKFLESGQVPLVHHCKLGNEYGIQTTPRRAEYEWKAIQDIREWFTKKGYPEFEFVYSSFDYGTVGWNGNDIEIVGFVNGMMLRKTASYNLRGRDYSNITKIVVSVNADDVSSFGYLHRSTSRKFLTNKLAERLLDYVEPIKDRRKLEILLDMPEDLLDLCYWCRCPWGDRKNCGNCDPCAQIIKMQMVKAGVVTLEGALKWK